MKFIQNIQILLLIFILQPFNINGQSAQKKPDRYITMLDINGRPVPDIIINVEGSPYFIDSFWYADVLLTDGKLFENVQMKINLQNHEVHFITGDKKEIIADQGVN